VRRARRELHDEAGATEGTVIDADAALVPHDDRADDGQPEAAATLVPGAAVVEAGESLEDPLPVVRWDAGSVVVDDDARRVVVAREGDVHRRRGETGGIVVVELSLSGELDLATAPRLAEAMAWIRASSGVATTIVIDTGEIEFMAAAGYHALHAALVRPDGLWDPTSS
jgi:hypothetical protein